MSQIRKNLRVWHLGGHLQVSDSPNPTGYYPMKTHSIIPTALLAILAFTPVSALQAEQKPQSAQPSESAKPKVKPYPLKTCVVSDDDLGSMGKPVVFVYKGQEIKLCCKACRKDFNQDPEKYLKKLEPKK
jgi:hypothetical protein